MIVQERGNGNGKGQGKGKGGGGGLVADSGEESDKDMEQAELSPSNFKPSWRKSYNFSFCSEHLPKLVILVLIVSSLLALAFYRNRDETSALLCIQEVAKETELAVFPDVEFKNVKAAKDYTRYASVTADKWIVLTVAGPPTPQVEVFANVRGWQVLAVGTEETPADWRVENVIFLSISQQVELKYRINSYLPTNTYIRKNIGYLFAIQHGARKIYDADENASLLKSDLETVFDVELLGSQSKREPVLQYRYFDTRKVVNPFVHFGQRSVWPRGLPLEAIREIDAEVSYAEVTTGKQFIQQSLANGLPDVDSIFYFTRKSQATPLDITFDSHAPPVVLPQGYMAPTNALNTLFHSSAFWALLLPVSVGSKTADIIRGYWGQRLLWEVGGVLGVYPPLISRKDTLEGLPFKDEKDLHAKANLLVSYLLNWRSHERSLFERIYHLSRSLAAEGFWAGEDVHLTAAWLQDLISVGYTQPRLMTIELDRNRTDWTTLGHRQFLPHAFAAPYLGVEDTTGMESQMTDLIRWRHFYGNIVLILECVGPVNQTVLGWRMLYGRLFKHIIILGEVADEGLNVEAYSRPSYRSFAKIFDRHPNADGFLVLKDDVVLNYWNLVMANKTKIWNVHKVSSAWTVYSMNDNGSSGFQSAEMKRSVRKAFRAMPPVYRITYRKSIGEDSYVASPSDVYYVPQRLVTDFITLITPVSKAGLPEELAIPMIFLAIDKPEDFDSSALSAVLYVDDKRLKKQGGGDPAALYKSDVDAYHPWRATSEAELGRLYKVIGKRDVHLLDAFD